MPLMPGPIIPGSPAKRGVEFGGPQHNSNMLHRRATPRVNEGRKEVSFWTLPNTQTPFIIETEYYPSYPDFYKKPFNPIPFDGNIAYSDILMYYHNTTAICTSFDIQKAPTYDKIYKYGRNDKNGPYAQGILYHQHYDTEHVFEGQTISRFFATWLPNNGYSRSWSEKWAFTMDREWQNLAFVHLVIDELGSSIHYDRLAIFLTNSNGMKGSLFSGATSTTDARFKALDAGAEQLLNVRELGYIFSYMGRDEVWDAFCDTYSGILDLMERFDAWYLKKTTNTSDMEVQWIKFIRSELDMVVKKARDDVTRMYGNKKPAGKKYDDFWEVIMKGPAAEMNKVKLDKIGKCKKLPATSVPAWKFP